MALGTVSHFEVQRPLGRGGMGEVYEAFDLKVKRPVALKFVAHRLVAEPDARRRLLIEARAAGSLNHTNICTIHEVGEVRPGEQVRLASGEPVPPGTPFIAMELIRGRGLDELLAGSPRMKVAEIIDVAIQVAEGLAEAHANGIVHRDLKPQNIRVTEAGRVKILDFGLAKPLVHRGTARNGMHELSETRPLTREGALVGTTPYMSPEQAAGKSVDQRSDVFSFGILLYEMVTGKRPFKADTGPGVRAKILELEPEPVSRVRLNVPRELARIIHRCLRKRPEERYNDTRDLVVALRDIQGKQRRWTRYVVLSLSGLSLIAVAYSLRDLWDRGEATSIEVPSASYRQLTYVGNAAWPEISPDGRYIAFFEEAKSGETRLLVKDVGGGPPLEIYRLDRNPRVVRWSPDGSRLLFLDPSLPKAVIAHHLGGESRRLPGAYFLAWGPRGDRYASAWTGSRRITFVETASGDTSFVELEDVFEWVTSLDWSPTGNFLLLKTRDRNDTNAVWVLHPEGEPHLKVLESSTAILSPRWSPDGGGIYYLVPQQHASDIYRIRIDPRTGARIGEPVKVLGGLETGGRDASFSLSNENQLVYSKTTMYSNLRKVTWNDPGGDPETSPLTSGTFQDSWPRISPDGSRVVFVRNGDLYLVPVKGGGPVQLTFMGSCGEPAWSPDGNEIVFGSQQDGELGLWRIRLDGPGPRRAGSANVSYTLLEREIDVAGFSFLAWEPGREILYQVVGNENFNRLDPRTGAEVPLLPDTRAWVFNACYSPDGNRVAMLANAPEGLGVRIFFMDDASSRTLYTGRVHPVRWSNDDETLWCYERTRKEMIGIGVHTGEESVRDLPFEEVGGISMNPEGSLAVCSVYQIIKDIWMVEGLDFDGD